MQISKTLIVFSSSKSIQVAERIKKTLDKEFETTIWNQGFFDGSHLPPVWTFLKNLMCYDFAAIVLGADDIMEVPDIASSGNQIKTTYVPKDNVVFELGAVMARIGPQKTFVFKPRKPSVKIPSYFDNPDREKIKKGSDIEEITTFVEYNRMEDMASIDEACEKVLNKIGQMKKQDKFHSDLPSQGLAHGYADNFLLPVCKNLIANKDQPFEWNPAAGFTITVIIPNRIMKWEEVVPELEYYLGYIPECIHIYPENQSENARHSSVLILQHKNNDSPLHIIDLPTTLRTSLKVIDRIDEYWLKDNSSDFVSKLQLREIMNFYKALEQICVEHPILQKVPFYIKSFQELNEHINHLEYEY